MFFLIFSFALNSWREIFFLPAKQNLCYSTHDPCNMLTNVTNQDCKNPKIPKVYSCKSSTAGNGDSQLTGKFGCIRSSAERQMWCMAGRACAISTVSPPLWSNKDEHPQLQSCSYLSWVFPIALIIATIRREMLFWRALESRKLNLPHGNNN